MRRQRSLLVAREGLHANDEEKGTHRNSGESDFVEMRGTEEDGDLDHNLHDLSHTHLTAKAA